MGGAPSLWGFNPAYIVLQALLLRARGRPGLGGAARAQLDEVTTVGVWHSISAHWALVLAGYERCILGRWLRSFKKVPSNEPSGNASVLIVCVNVLYC